MFESQVYNTTCYKNSNSSRYNAGKTYFDDWFMLLIHSRCGHVVRDFESEAKKLGRTFNSDKLGGIAFTKISKLTMCSA